MSKDDMTFGISQLIGLDDRAEGWVVPADAAVYFDQAVRIRTCNAEELSKIKAVGRGGTCFAEFFSQYEKHVGKCDFLIIITDGQLMDTDIAEMRDPGIDVYWIITSETFFQPPFGRSFQLRA